MSASQGLRPNTSASEDEKPTLGTKLTDILPIPANTESTTEHETATTMADKPSLSHALAVTDNKEGKDVAQRGHPDYAEVVNLGWNEREEEIVSPLVGGLNNEDLWLLVRRFNKQIYHVKEVQNPVPGNLDLNIADEEEFSPDKLRANVERLYMTVIIGVLNVVKHVARLRSWKEPRRTSCFCAAFFITWLFDLLVPLIALTSMVVVVHPPSRRVLFPPAPIALVDIDSGGIQKPKAGVLGSLDSATGAPENYKGEAVEQEASSFFNGFTSVVLTSATGKHPHPQDEPGSEEETTVTDKLPDPTRMTTGIAEAKDLANGEEPGSKRDKTKVPVEKMIWLKMRPLMHGMADMVDTWERFGNALSPTPPFPHDTYRLRVAALLAPLLLTSFFVTTYLFVKGVAFGAGLIFFGDPVIAPGLRLVDRHLPHWRKVLELRNTVLKGVPTNAQLALTLLRIGEANHAPLPPPPSSRVLEEPQESWHPAELTGHHLGSSAGDDQPLGASDDEVRRATEYDPAAVPDTTGDAAESSPPRPAKRGSRILGFFRGATRGAVKTAIGTDHARATAGSRRAKDRLGAVSRATHRPTSGPVAFRARHDGRKGHVYITTEATVPAVAFGTHTRPAIEEGKRRVTAVAGTDGNEKGEDPLHPVWSIPAADIRELKKIGGYGWKGRIVVGWSLGRAINDGLEITDRYGRTVRITAVPLRDELFNRLVAMGGQKWEAW